MYILHNIYNTIYIIYFNKYNIFKIFKNISCSYFSLMDMNH